MAQDLSSVKTNVASGMAQIAARLLALLRDADEAAAKYFAEQLNSGAANAYTQADMVGANTYLTPAAVSGVVNQLQAVSAAVTAGGRDVLRQAIPTLLP